MTPAQLSLLMKILFAGGLVVVTVVIHAVGFSVLLRALMRSHALQKSGFRRIYPLLVALTCWLILIHSVEICVWGGVLFLAGLPARCRVCVLFFRCHLRDRWLRRTGVAQAVADARTARGIDGHSHVRALDRARLRDRPPVDHQLDEKANRTRTSLRVSNEKIKRYHQNKTMKPARTETLLAAAFIAAVSFTTTIARAASIFETNT